MQRIPYPQLSAEQQKEFERRRSNVSRIMYLLPEKIRQGFSAAGRTMLFDSDYDSLLRELIILRVGYLSNCAYEAHQHRAYGKKMGLSEAQIEAAMAVELGEPLTERERVVLAFVEEVVRDVRPSDTALERTRYYLTDTEIVETLWIIGNYMFIARVVETTGIPLDDDNVIVSDPNKNN